MPNLSDEIIYGTLEGVTALLSQKDLDLDAMDQYGSTPLIAAARVKKASIVKLLLTQGAHVDVTDASGYTALYWATEKRDLASAQVLLDAKADPNQALPGNQPILVYPVLRKDKAMGELLLAHGASLPFAMDFIHAKLIAHRYELADIFYLLNTEHTFVPMSLEGFFLEFTPGIIHRSLQDFIKHRDAKNFAEYFHFIEKVIHALTLGSELRQYREDALSYKDHETRIDQILDADPLIIPVSYEGHAVTFIKYKNYLAHCDRGAQSKIKGSVVIYKINKMENFHKDFIKKLLYESHSGQFINIGVFVYLGLEHLEEIPTESQIAGNCSWANVESSVAALLAMQLLEKVPTQDRHARIQAREMALRLHAAWIEWDKDRALYSLLTHMDKADKARKASLATLLGKVLFHCCSYSSEKGIERARKILQVLTIKDFRFVIESYARSYCLSGHPTLEGERFKKLLEKCQVDITPYLGKS